MMQGRKPAEGPRRGWRLLALALAGCAVAPLGCRAPGSATASRRAEGVVHAAAVDTAPAQGNHRPADEDRSAGASGMASTSGSEETAATMPSRWSRLLGRFGSPRRIPLPRTDAELPPAMAGEAISPGAAAEDF